MSAQCAVHGLGTSTNSIYYFGPNEYIGQTFQACADGEITTISFNVNASTLAGTHNLRISSSANPATAIIGGVAYQSFTMSGGSETIIINLSPPFAVTNGNDYVFEIERGSSTIEFVKSIPGDEPTGEVYHSLNGTFSNQSTRDLDFEVQVSFASSGGDVPTLSEWGLIILALLLMTLGTLYLVQPNWRGRFEQEG